MSNNNSPTKKPLDQRETSDDAAEEVDVDRPFNIHIVNESFAKSLTGEDDVFLPDYVTAYRELNK